MGTWGTFLQKDFLPPKLFLPKQIFLYPKGGTSIFLKDPTFPRQAAEKIIFWKPSLKTFNHRLPSDFSGKQLTAPLNVTEKPPAAHLKYPVMIPVAITAMGNPANSAVQTCSALNHGDDKHAHQQTRRTSDYDMRDANKDPTDHGHQEPPPGSYWWQQGGCSSSSGVHNFSFKESVFSPCCIFRYDLSSIIYTDKSPSLFECSVAEYLKRTFAI